MVATKKPAAKKPAAKAAPAAKPAAKKASAKRGVAKPKKVATKRPLTIVKKASPKKAVTKKKSVPPEHDDNLRAFSHIAPADREALRFATMALNLPEDEAWFVTWDLMAETKSYMEEPNYAILEGTLSGNTWVPLQTTDIEREIKAICASNATSCVHVVLSNLEGTEIPDDFLRDCDQLVSCVVRSSKVTSIGHNVLRGCSSLTSIDMSGLTAVTSIGDGFLRECSSLASIDMSGLTAVTSIGYGFLSECSSLTSIDMSGLTAVTSVGDYFLAGVCGSPAVYGVCGPLGVSPTDLSVRSRDTN